MNPLGHMVSLMSSTVTSWWRAGAPASELDQRLRGAGEAAVAVVAAVTTIDEAGREARERCRAGSCVAAVARARSAPTAVEHDASSRVSWRSALTSSPRAGPRSDGCVREAAQTHRSFRKPHDHLVRGFSAVHSGDSLDDSRSDLLANFGRAARFRQLRRG